MTDAITIQNPRNRGGSTGHVLAKRSVTFTEIRKEAAQALFPLSKILEPANMVSSNSIGFWVIGQGI